MLPSKPYERVVVADAVDGLAGDLGDLDVGRRADLAGDDAQARGDHRLAGDAAVGILGEDGVENGVGDLVGHLVGMALGDAFGGEGVIGHGQCFLSDVAARMATIVLMTARATSRLAARSISTGSASGRSSVTAFVS